MSDLNMSPGKITDFGFTSIVWFHVSHKTEISISKVIETLYYYLIKKDVVSDLNMSHGKISDFGSLPLLRFTLVIKLRNFDFGNH